MVVGVFQNDRTVFPQNFYQLVHMACDTHPMAMETLAFNDRHLYKLCKDHKEASVQVCPKTGRKRIKFGDLCKEYNVVGLCGQCSLITEYLLRTKVISEEFSESVKEDKIALPFGLYFITPTNELPAFCLFWNPNDCSDYDSKALVLLRILCQQSSEILLFDNTEVATLRDLVTKQVEESQVLSLMTEGIV